MFRWFCEKMLANMNSGDWVGQGEWSLLVWRRWRNVSNACLQVSFGGSERYNLFLFLDTRPLKNQRTLFWHICIFIYISRTELASKLYALIICHWPPSEKWCVKSLYKSIFFFWFNFSCVSVIVWNKRSQLVFLMIGCWVCQLQIWLPLHCAAPQHLRMSLQYIQAVRKQKKNPQLILFVINSKKQLWRTVLISPGYMCD